MPDSHSNLATTCDPFHAVTAEGKRLLEDQERVGNWKRWGPYLAERQWGTVREDYSPDGSCWDSFPHDHARSRAYRWGEDGILGITDRECRLCFSIAMWNGKDPILKERLFGLTGPQGNHGEDVKEDYFYLDSTPTHSYMKGLYKYPQAEFPYQRLIDEAGRRTRQDAEFELVHTGVFDESRYFDVQVEYAKHSPDDILCRVTVTNRGPEHATIHLLPQLWYRNTWSWGSTHEGSWPRGRIERVADGLVLGHHASLGRTVCAFDDALVTPAPNGKRSKKKYITPCLLFTENETNAHRLFGSPNPQPYVRDAFHEYVVNGNRAAVNPDEHGSKMAAHYVMELAPGASAVIPVRMWPAPTDGEDTPRGTRGITPGVGADFDAVFAERLAEADDFYAHRINPGMPLEARRVTRQAYAGLMWSKQFFHYSVKDWLEGDPLQPPPSEQRKHGRNTDWQHLFNRDIISMPDKWEYPWYAAWDLAFHVVAIAKIDAEFAKQQLILMLREWYMHPNGQIPAYEFALGDVNPPVHAWAAWRVYKMTGKRGVRGEGGRDRCFLERVFHKLLINFTWWVNRKDPDGKNLFAGGFLGLDNIGVFDRSQPLPSGLRLEQADGTAWMAFYCGTMLSIALELASENPAYDDVASKFFEHFVAITDAMNHLGGSGLWDETDGFYYDQLMMAGDVHNSQRMKIRSMVGLIPLYAVEVLEEGVIQRAPGFRKRMEWFLEHRRDLAKTISYMKTEGDSHHAHRLLAIPSRDRLQRVLRYMLDENEFLSPHGVRSVSRHHKDHPYVFRADGREYAVNYVPGESDTAMFGGNSNWRGPVWFPTNYLLVESLERYHHFYGDSFKVECPTGSGKFMTLGEAAEEIRRRLASIFLPDAAGQRPCHADDARYSTDPHWKDLVLFHEYFHGDTGKGLGASHQTGWTGLVAELMG